MIATDVRIEDVIKSETGDAFLSDRMGADLHDDATNADVPPLFDQTYELTQRRGRTLSS